MEPRLHQRLQIHGHDRLGDPVGDRWHAEHSDPAAVRLGDLDRPDRRRKVATPSSSDSRSCRGCPQIGLELAPGPARPLPGHPCWPRPAGTPPTPSAWESRTACPWALACSSRFLPELTPRLIETDIPGEPAPWLHPHPSEQGLHSYYGPVRQRAPQLGTQCLRFPPRHAPSRDLGPATPVAVSTLAFSRSVQEPQTRLTPPLRRAPPGQYTGTRQAHLEGKLKDPRFRCHFRLSTPQQRTPARNSRPSASGTSSWSPPDAVTPRLFPGRSPRRSSANAAQGGLAPAPEGRRWRANNPPSLAQHRLLKSLLHDSSFSVRDTRA